MTSDDNDDNQGVVWAILIGVILLAISLAVGMGLYRTGKASVGASTGGAVSTADAGAAAAASVVASEPSAAGLPAHGTPGSTADMTNGSADVASIRVENGIVKFYFASASADLAQGAAEALGDVVKGVAAGQKAVISGYHDITGDPAKNEELAKQRALAVRDALASLGIGEDKMDLRKPEVTTADGSNAEARRVEVTLQ
ncbi:MAG: OmpA family protein [Ottowia sp.]|nr:OmpA family protein [Ottowia sp.]